ncbi:hypothetical protein WJX72_008194 [[Myrmecia] bisecta]|uniref:Uncharacterized protein n=1 Tax=[Myrmecia] bisecta TaxID=41462 RepID=A0AAW1PT90_9CHLO
MLRLGEPLSGEGVLLYERLVLCRWILLRARRVRAQGAQRDAAAEAAFIEALQARARRLGINNPLNTGEGTHGADLRPEGCHNGR